MNQARADILASHDGKPPKVLDPFGGGGSIPLEAQRLGCETYSCDLNPVAVLIQKCTLEFPQKYGQKLHVDVKKWGEQIIAQVTGELKSFYPKEPDGSHIFAHIWARTLPCQNLTCSATIPLMRQFWLANKANKKVALFPYEADGQVAFRIVGTGYEPMPTEFDPAKGTVTRATVTCPLCKNTIPAKETHRLFQENAAGERMLVVVTQHPHVPGKRYRLATDADLKGLASAQSPLSEKRERLSATWRRDPVPDERTPEGKGGAPVMVRNYNLNTYGALFNPRQQLFLVTFTEKIRRAHQEMLAQGYDTDYARAVTTYLGLWLNRIAQRSSNLCMWHNITEFVAHLFNMQALSVAWDYAEANPMRKAADMLQTLLRPLKHLSQMRAEPVTVRQATATNIPYSDNMFDAVLTDPPYYNNIGYSYLSEFFYVWLKRSVGELYPELFQGTTTPKPDEIVAYPHLEGRVEATKRFEKGLSAAFAEVHRVLKPNGIAIIVYAHKSTAGWETLINALLDSGLVITAAWPIEAEMKTKYGAEKKATLVSSIYMVARKTAREAFGLYKEVHAELAKYLRQRYVELWESGISGSDLFIAAIGSALQVFGKYEQVTDFTGALVRADKMLEDIQKIVADSAAGQVPEEATPLTRFYLTWRQEHGEKRVTFDEASKVARFVAGIELADEWEKGSFIQKEGKFIRVLGPHEREPASISKSGELIDVLHHALLCWRSGNRKAMISCLAQGGLGLDNLIWNVAQAVNLALPPESQERNWLGWWLADRESIEQEVAKQLETAKQGELL